MIPAVDEIVANFELLDEWDERYRYLIELGRMLPALPPEAHNDANKVQGCASQVWLEWRIEPAEPEPLLHWRGDSDAHIVRGLTALLLALYSGRPASQVLATDALALFHGLGLSGHLTPQRSNGVRSMVERIRTDARLVAAAACEDVASLRAGPALPALLAEAHLLRQIRPGLRIVRRLIERLLVEYETAFRTGLRQRVCGFDPCSRYMGGMRRAGPTAGRTGGPAFRALRRNSLRPVAKGRLHDPGTFGIRFCWSPQGRTALSVTPMPGVRSETPVAAAATSSAIAVAALLSLAIVAAPLWQ